MAPLEQVLSAPTIGDHANPPHEWQRLVAASSRDLSRAGQVSSKCLQFIGEHFKERRNVGFYAKQLFVSPDYLRQCCKQVLGLPPSHCIALRVVVEAMNLISGGVLAMGELAHQLGFESHPHFCHFLKKHTGLSPTGLKRLG